LATTGFFATAFMGATFFLGLTALGAVVLAAGLATRLTAFVTAALGFEDFVFIVNPRAEQASDVEESAAL
jgi:hypothetical protein